jgi:hypothetical protein
MNYQLVIKIDIKEQPDDISAREMVCNILDKLDTHPGLKYHLLFDKTFSIKLQEIEKDKIPRGVRIKIKPLPTPDQLADLREGLL